MPEPPKPPFQPAETPTAAATGDEANPMMYCPVCSQRLEQSKCKLKCRRCGYYMSCADYY